MRLARRIKIYQKRYIKYDLVAGLVVFLVAIPLCLGIALASGAPLLSGIISGIIGGVVVGILSQSSISVSGPAAGMIAIVVAAIVQLGSFPLFLTALVVAGVLQILFGILKAGFIGDYIPSNVIQGLLCAIGILIIIKQLPLAFTHTVQNQFLMEQLKQSALSDFAFLKSLPDHINLGAAIISLVSLAVLIYGNISKSERVKNIPAPIVVVILGVIINEIFISFSLSPEWVQTSAELVSIPVQHNFKDFIGQLSTPNWQGLLNYNVYFYGAALAILASLETLLNIQATEKLDKRRRYVSRNRE